ncbi:glycosyltransferase [Sphingomonas sp. SUN039]|uniref:glycosyltransferase n=1 Tax=Sphingomonas sp. SUN039 TaxID=2937787 RepID=UPI0021641375|nr:glycosyltransferase [Sphingomonas sp. SUN039]UVO55388.1 glycosyltransferase [Sphingomonas sp. SUN039]
MRVLTYLHSFEPGGLERDVLRFNRAWQERGVDVRIVLGRNEGALADDAPDLPYTVLQTGRVSTAPIESLWMIWHLPRIVRAMRPDIVVCAGNSYSIVAVGLRLALGRKCPPIIHRVSNDLVRRDLAAPLRWANRVWQHLQAPVFAMVVGMAEPARAEIIEYMGADPRRVVAINNASLTQADIDGLARTRSAAPRDRAGRHYLAVGRLAAQKNFDLLLTSFAAMARPDDRLTIVGEGPLRAALESRAASLGIAAQVAMPGHQNTVGPWLADADALVLSSDYEGLGIVVIEALAAGLPVVATDCGPNMALLLEGVGRLVPPRDTAALATAMAAIVEDPVDAGAMRARAQQFTVEANIGSWLDLFDRVSR